MQLLVVNLGIRPETILWPGIKAMNEENRTCTPNALSVSFEAAARPVVTVDIERYQAYLEGSGLSEAQKEEFIQALWSIVVAFVELGFGVHPLQEVCGQNSAECLNEKTSSYDLVESTSSKLLENIIYSGPSGGLEVE